MPLKFGRLVLVAAAVMQNAAPPLESAARKFPLLNSTPIERAFFCGSGSVVWPVISSCPALCSHILLKRVFCPLGVTAKVISLPQLAAPQFSDVTNPIAAVAEVVHPLAVPVVDPRPPCS